jgi:hypothetical protein
MNNIRLIRLQNGDDIIASFEIVDTIVKISEPMLVQMHHQGTHMGLILQHWLPIQLIKKNETILQPKDIICVVEPNDQLITYYTNTVEKIKRLFDARDMGDEEGIEEEMESINLAMEELQEDSDVVIH